MRSDNGNGDVLAEWSRWRDEFVYRLRRQGMTGKQVGEVLKEVEAHIRESGESPAVAFGDPAAYAAIRAVDPRPVGWSNPGSLAEVAGTVLGTGMMVWSAVLSGRDESLPLGLHPFFGLVTGLVILFLVLRQVPRDTVTDPETGRPMMGSRPQHHIRLLALLVFVGIIMVFALIFI
jgi:hypothetical protein